ncbi:N-terminal C2 in EEIG1 and EHBP1 proteins-domain-containing protein [Dipodascopsis tothii]|uniref:N-terminal C2 in EEIG1 and EHBP1 proteins-domain-containing protein n=1 Tax=Dipodascopsis tothii TaxID=44089 RepID=UPI0034CFDF64
MNAFLPKLRKPKFLATLTIHDLTNIPLLTGYVSVKWHVKESTRGDARGRTSRVAIKDHTCTWDYTRETKVRMVIDKTGMLSSKHIMFEVVSEHAGEKVELGSLAINPAEYAREKPTARRYLLQNSKINSTLKVTLALTQLSGESTFVAPPLSSGQVFGGITGVIEQKDKDDPSAAQSAVNMMNVTSPSLYRTTLTATWQRQVGELPAAACIEDIFAGGDGWAKDPDGTTARSNVADAIATALHQRDDGEISIEMSKEDLRSWSVRTMENSDVHVKEPRA